MEQIIHLSPDDDLTAIKTHLEWADARRVLMVVPRRNKTLRSEVTQKVLARSADTLNIDLAFATQDIATRAAAKRAGIQVFATEWIARRRGFIGAESVKSAARVPQPQLQVIKTPDTPPPKRMRIKNKRLVVVVGSGKVGFLQQFIALILAGVMALALIVLVLALSPAATVNLIPKVEVISTEVTLYADPNVDAIDTENNIIPARPVQIELTLFTEINTIDTEYAAADFATGRVVIFNRTQDEQIIPISTTLKTSSGVPIKFITTLTATVPAGTGATTSTTVIALKPGPIGNVTSGQINRFVNPSLGLLVRVINDVPTSGGSLRESGVVTNDDKDRVRSKLRQLIQQKGYDDMRAELDPQEYIPPETLQVIELDLTYNKFAGDVSDTFGAEMHAVVRGTVVADYDANQLAYSALLDKVPPGKTLLPKGLRFSAGGIQAVTDRAVTFPVMADGLVVSRVDANLVKEAIIFKPIGSAQAWLSEHLPIVSVPGIDVEPNWLGRLPVFPFRITVNVEDVSPLIFGADEK